MKLSLNTRRPYIILVCLIATNLFTFYFTRKKDKLVAEADMEQSSSAYSENSACAVKVKRLNGYSYIKPVLFVDKVCESDELMPLKESITNMITSYKNSGVLNSASVYFKEYGSNSWFTINDDERYQPGSLFKVPELIAYLKMNEMKPGILNKVIKYNKRLNTGLKQNFASKSIQVGQQYTIKELLTYMIVYSDNEATALLNANINIPIFNKVFTDLGLKYPDNVDSSITAKEYTYFMRTLFNGSYLSRDDSEYATELLSYCNFTEGMRNSLPTTVKIAHKFGESGNLSEQQLHESGIIYLDDKPYVLTIMTKGKDYKKLSGVIKEISSTVYQNMLNNTKVTI